MSSLWVPDPLTVTKVVQETADTVTFALDASAAPRPFAPGQFNMLYLFGMGEVPISIAGDPARPETVLHTVRGVGHSTRPMLELSPGDVVGVRGPFGSAWPVADAQGRDLVFVCGGIGLAPLRPAILYALANRDDYGRIVVLYGARTPLDLLYVDELQTWRGRLDSGLHIDVTVDQPRPKWRGHVGVVTALLARAEFDPDDTVLMTCGPEIMMHFVIREALNRGIPPADCYVSMERNMKCAVGLCGRCQWGPSFVCRDGPVFSHEAVKPLLRVRGL